MTVYKQIQVNFWQNPFVLDLAPEERYFYIYLITNTMTTSCGIYRFNLKLAVLETGLSSEEIINYLSAFESSGKIAFSKISQEIMIVNWLKHNSKMNKKIMGQINTELKEVKDKELLRQFYEICKARQYPVEAIFNGVDLPAEVKMESDNEVKIQQANIVQAVQEAGITEEKDAETASQTASEDVKENRKLLFTDLKPAYTGNRRSTKEKSNEEVEVYESYDDSDQELVIKGTPVAAWSFNDSGGALISST